MSEDDELGDEGDEKNSEVDIVAKLAYDSCLRQCQNQILKSAALHLDFWNSLIEESPDIAKLSDCGSKIN